MHFYVSRAERAQAITPRLLFKKVARNIKMFRPANVLIYLQSQLISNMKLGDVRSSPAVRPSPFHWPWGLCQGWREE